MTSPTVLPTQLYTAAQTRELDRIAIEDFAIPGYELMQRAGQTVMQVVLRNWRLPKLMTIFCGVGNNGGDGFVIATLAKRQGIGIRVLLVGASNKITGDARLAYDAALHDGIEVETFTDETELAEGVVVDALLGTGLTGKVRKNIAAAIKIINQSTLPIIAVDIPSGLCSDNGTVLGCAVKAHKTVTFIGLKRGLLTSQGPEVCGDIHFSDLQIPSAVYRQVPSTYSRISTQALLPALTARTRDAHKGLFGHVLLVGGDFGMAGAVALAAEAAARTGAGLVSVATRAEHVSAIVARRPEVMAHGVSEGLELKPLIAKANVIVIGPGLGRSAWSKQLLNQIMQTPPSVPLVVDADALNILSEDSTKPQKRGNWVLTPHPGEAARLLNINTQAVKEKRFETVAELQRRYGGYVVLKGAGSLIATDNEVLLCNAGNPGMASGGMGDVLSGIVGGLIAQQAPLSLASQLAVCLHAEAGDLAATMQGERGLLASDLFTHIRRLVNGL